ncbi:DegT/DnrJ/EryC1/StrS family aminotransferase [Helicobacter sp. 11S02629-2]|uniref:DegT/DnrJ/EryC1/StrS family aminotransferase n=1 Tax=Helicobacter sp. 11S02629-2 TaxID=1476195 RepID=UPI000BA4E826|nr:DegT/DnrJ/EryC1/StrS family aminotransferase [Helicobacter sp. 11S02629-2]PAF45664.1 hypothetical protein BKH40_01930 [Helicobacter sp. 11S02629-2]
MKEITPFTSFTPYSRQSISDEDKACVLEALSNPLITQGEINESFEKALANYAGTKHALSFNSATSALYALYASLRALDLGDLESFFYSLPSTDSNYKTKSIITTPITFSATANMMLACGFKPIFADVTFDGNLDPLKCEEILEEKKARGEDDVIAIMSVDYAGNSVDAEAFKTLAKKYDIKWLSDSSHALGASFKGSKVGSLAYASIFSFHALKSITTAEGGALLTNDSKLYEIAKLIRSHGMVKKELYHCDQVNLGFNFRLSEINAALGLSQLQRLDSFIDTRNELSNIYDAAFKDSSYFYPLKVKKEDDTRSSRHLYPILLDPKYHCAKESIVRRLLELNVGTQVHYKPLYNFSFFKDYKPKNEHGLLRNAEDFYRATLSLPLHCNLDKEDIGKIASIVIDVFDEI